MSAPKLCKDCKHYVQSDMGSGYDKCLSHPTHVNSGRPLVRGEQLNRSRHCDIERMWGWLDARMMNSCGKEARWWEAK